MFNCAVVNAGPLVALSLLDQLDLLPALYAECWVPQTVFNEVAVAGLGKPGAKSLQSSDWLARVGVSPRHDTSHVQNHASASIAPCSDMTSMPSPKG